MKVSLWVLLGTFGLVVLIGVLAYIFKPEPPPVVVEQPYRCIRADFLVPTEWGIIKLGEVAMCGKDLRASHVLGPKLEAFLNEEGDIIKMRPTGTLQAMPGQKLPEVQ